MFHLTVAVWSLLASKQCVALYLFSKNLRHIITWRRFFPVSYVNVSLIYCLCFHIRSFSIVRSLLNNRSIYTSACLEIIRYIYNNRFVFPIITSLLFSAGNLAPHHYANNYEILHFLELKGMPMSMRNYYLRREEAINVLSSVLWGYTSTDCEELINRLLPE